MGPHQHRSRSGDGLAVFYGIIFGLLLLPTVGRVFALAEAQLHAREARFKISGDSPRDHFVVDRDVAQFPTPRGAGVVLH